VNFQIGERELNFGRLLLAFNILFLISVEFIEKVYVTGRARTLGRGSGIDHE